MARNDIINVRLFGREIGRIGLDEQRRTSSFQYHPDFLQRNEMLNVFPMTGVLRRTTSVQTFSNYHGETFKGLPPQFADSLPDMFGSLIFKTWLEAKAKEEITVLEQLAYVASRGMGALEYEPSKHIPKNTSIDLDEVITVLREVLDQHKSKTQPTLSTQALLNIFKIGTSAGGARPKILISENIRTGRIIPGDLEYSDDYHHYLVKLAMEEASSYPREVIEYCYYLIIKKLGIDMMESKLIDDKHFATLRYDRQGGEKRHVLTASGLTGWDYKDPTNSSYENLFKLCTFLRVPHGQAEELYKRMIFNIVFGNTDDHLKNHSFMYDVAHDRWNLSPVYDVTYALNPLIDFKTTIRALSVNGKRNGIILSDVLKIADDYTIKNPKGIIEEVQSVIPDLIELMHNQGVPRSVIVKIERKLIRLI